MMLPGPIPDPFNQIFTYVNQLLDSKLAVFEGMGIGLLRGFAVILLAWFGIKSALSAASGGSGFHFARFVDLLLIISLGFTMLTFYSHPLPGVGYSFAELVTQQAEYLSNSVGADYDSQIIEAISQSEEQLGNPPGVFSFHEELIYFVVILLLAAVQAVTVMVVAYGLIATAVCILVGPIFIPFFIVPGMDWLFWGWFKSFLQFSFYQVIANAFIFVVARLILGFLTVTGPVNLDNAATLMPALFMFLLTSIYGLIKIPSLTSSIFTGRSGDFVIPL